MPRAKKQKDVPWPLLVGEQPEQPHYEKHDAAARGTEAYYAEGTAARAEPKPEPDGPLSAAVELRRLILKLGESRHLDGGKYLAAERAALKSLDGLCVRVVAAPPFIATKTQLKQAGDVLNRNADAMQKAGARWEDHYAQNQLAHWLWILSGAEKP